MSLFKEKSVFDGMPGYGTPTDRPRTPSPDLVGLRHFFEVVEAVTLAWLFLSLTSRL